MSECVCMCICVYVCVCIMYMYIHAYTNICTQTHAQLHPYLFLYLSTYIENYTFVIPPIPVQYHSTLSNFLTFHIYNFLYQKMRKVAPISFIDLRIWANLLQASTLSVPGLHPSPHLVPLSSHLGSSALHCPSFLSY